MADIHEVEILVVEDNPHHAKWTVRVLRKYHMAIIVKPVTFEGLVNAVSEVGLYWTILNRSAKTLMGR
jgi:hypothetical protein